MIAPEDRNGKVLYDSDDHKVIWLGIDEKESDGVIQANQYLIIHKGRGILLDPGGVHLFARVVAVISRYIDLNKIDTILFSHQDPDVSSGIALWLGICPARVYISSLWLRFLPHFGIVDQKRIIGIENQKGSLPLGAEGSIQFVPSHFLHSVGCFSFFDTISRTLFSGDIGAAVFSPPEQVLFIDDFAGQKHNIEPFHRRYMGGHTVAAAWCRNVRRLNLNILAPQHGALYRDKALEDFLAWFETLRCGIDILDELYER